MKLTDIDLREKEFHNKLQSQKDERFENRFYKAIHNIGDDFLAFLKNNVKDKEVLDYGCGIGTSAEKVSKFSPNRITGIDISEISINKAKDKAAKNNLTIVYKVDNCEKTSFDNDSFDIVYGSGILHHLQIDECLNEISRILKSKGNLVFIEPLGTNPIINFYRRLTPKSRSKDEHPFVYKDIRYIEKKFVEVKIRYYGFLTLLFFPFYNSPSESKLFGLLVSLDQFLFKFKIFQLFAWSILITAKKN